MRLHWYRPDKGARLKSEIILNRHEQENWYRENLNKIMSDTGWILDNLDYCEEFHVNWNNYSKQTQKLLCVECGKIYSIYNRQLCSCGSTRFRKIHYGVGFLREKQPIDYSKYKMRKK